MMGVGAEDQVVTAPALREVLPRVVHDVRRAQCRRRLHVSGAAHCGDFRSESVGDLHRKRADAAGRPVHRHLFARSEAPPVPKTLECGARRHGQGRRLFERHAGGLDRELRLRGARILGKGPAADPEHFVAGFEPGHVPADRFDPSGHVAAQAVALRLAQSHDQPHEARRAHRQPPIEGVGGRRANLDEHFAVFRDRFFDIPDLDDVRRSVSAVEGGFHG